MPGNAQRDRSRGKWLPVIIPIVLIATALPIVIAIAVTNRDDDNETENPATPDATVAASPTAGSDRLVIISGLSFEPEEIAVVEGETIAFRNTSSSEHRLEIDGKADEGLELQTGQSANWTASERGRFELVCTIHPNEMRGTITVQ